ncbi:tetratricopeptide (TPR) repeat protein [Pseudomonas lini]|nr:tetratricopeptide (TPR) repeat protein [Pseudomonas lini]
MNPLSEIKTKLAFTCVHEQIPEPSAEAEVLFQYARWLQKNNQLKQDKSVDVEIERLYRIAAENGHHKANINLQNGAMRGYFTLRGSEHLRLSERLIGKGVATGYYFVGIFLQQGSAGLQQDPEMALRYFRKAADEGSAQAQAYVGNKLAPIRIAPAVARQMRRCAAEQGNEEAAGALGIDLSTDGYYQEALEAFQLGVAAGDESSASFLRQGFRGPESDDQLYYLGQQEDLERAERYEKIWRVLARYSYANPTVPEINEILPLPPAKLPAWDGKLQWLEARLANVPPEKPSAALINQLAKAMVLDPATGKPMPGSPSFSETQFLEPTCPSNSPCPESGYWKILWSGEGRYVLLDRNVPRYFKQGEIMPEARLGFYRKQLWPLSDKPMETHLGVTWRLLG